MAGQCESTKSHQCTILTEGNPAGQWDLTKVRGRSFFEDMTTTLGVNKLHQIVNPREAQFEELFQIVVCTDTVIH